jgi:acetyl-CoA acyltransferase 1
VTRKEMDEFAERSFGNAEKTQKAGYFNEEIVPIKVGVKGKNGVTEKIVLDRDDGLRYGTTVEGLGKIRAAFPQVSWFFEISQTSLEALLLSKYLAGGTERLTIE